MGTTASQKEAEMRALDFPPGPVSFCLKRRRLRAAHAKRRCRLHSKEGKMTTATHVPLEEYLTTIYEPDVEYIDGELEERNVGEYDHNLLQKAILFWFTRREKEWQIRSIQEQRTRLTATKYRLPDVSVFRRQTPVEQVFTHPQLIAVEVLSPEDRHGKMQKKIKDYIEFGVPNIWIVDPRTREGWDCSTGSWVLKEHFEVSGSPVYLSLNELFRELDEQES